MLPMTLLATAIQADREREFRNRRPRTAGVPSGRRHPQRPDVQPIGDAVRQRVDATPIGLPAVAGSR